MLRFRHGGRASLSEISARRTVNTEGARKVQKIFLKKINVVPRLIFKLMQKNPPKDPPFWRNKFFRIENLKILIFLILNDERYEYCQKK